MGDQPVEHLLTFRMPGLYTSLHALARPALWGFFISLALLALSLLTLWWYPSSIEAEWPEKQSRRLHSIQESIEQQFRARINRLTTQVSMLLEDEDLFRRVREGSPAGIADLFERIESLRLDNTITLELTDAQGTVLLWTGRSVVPHYRNIIQQQNADSFLVVSSSNLHRFLSVGRMTGDQRFCVIASQPLEMNYPLSNRFVSPYSFSEELSGRLGVPVHLALNGEGGSPSATGFEVALPDFQGEILLRVTVEPPSLDEEIQSLYKLWRSIIAVLVIMLTLFLVLLVMQRIKAVNSRVLRMAIWIAVIWSIRLGWRLAEVPSVIMGGMMFDPTVYASPFYLNLTSSLGELFLSSLAVVMTAFLVNRIEHSSSPMFHDAKLPGFKKLALTLVLIVAAAGTPWIVRGYGAAMRSVAFDSTIPYQDPGSVLPSLTAGIMHANVFMLSLAVILIVVALFSSSFRIVRRLIPRISPDIAVSLTLILFGAGFLLFTLINRVPQVPAWVSPAIFVLCAIHLRVRMASEAHHQQSSGISYRGSVALVFAVFVLSSVMMDSKLHEKDRQRVETFARELLRPVDGWLSFVITEGLNSALDNVQEGARASGDSLQRNDIAFTLWAQTLISKEGYNSGVFVYDREGKEVSSFSVGLTSYEEYELLTRVFDAEEEALLVFERNLPQGRIKYYGAWGTLRTADGTPAGTVAMGLSASQRSLFRGETSELLRSTVQNRFERQLRPVTVTEYLQGKLASTTSMDMERDARIPEEVMAFWERNGGQFMWSEKQSSGNHIEVLYARDPSQPERVMAVHVGALDVRWHLFNLVKMMPVYGLLAFGFVLLTVVRSRKSRTGSVFGFREKLVTSFAVLSVVPLLVLAYYNRELAVDRLNETIGRRLSQELDLVEQRIISTVMDEEDFLLGINDDFCEVVASELRIDFTVYGRSALQASSRPELYKSSILDGRLHGPAFAQAVLLGKKFYQDSEQVGTVRYIVGYRPLYLGDRFLGVLAVPALYRLQEIDEELAQRNAFLLGAYALVVLIIIMMAVVLANRLSKPLRELSSAARRVGRGELNVRIPKRSSDEVGELVDAFHEMTEELKASREHLVRVERELAWKEMAKQVAHEIKNPLTPLKLSIQHLVKAYRDGVSNFGEVLDRVSGTVVEQVEALSRIASEFSNFARMPVRKFERVDVNELLRETVQLFAGVQGVEFRTTVSDIPLPLVADKDELRRALINIIRNSVQAMEQEGMVEIESSVYAGTCRIVLRDNGPGIPEGLQSKVFQPNFSTKTDGMGIGLAITRKIIEDLDGTVTLQSGVGQGTIVEIHLPLKHH